MPFSRTISAPLTHSLKSKEVSISCLHSTKTKAATKNDRESVCVKKGSAWRSELGPGNCSWA